MHHTHAPISPGLGTPSCLGTLSDTAGRGAGTAAAVFRGWTSLAAAWVGAADAAGTAAAAVALGWPCALGLAGSPWALPMPCTG